MFAKKSTPNPLVYTLSMKPGFPGRVHRANCKHIPSAATIVSPTEVAPEALMSASRATCCSVRELDREAAVTEAREAQMAAEAATVEAPAADAEADEAGYTVATDDEIAAAETAITEAAGVTWETAGVLEGGVVITVEVGEIPAADAETPAETVAADAAGVAVREAEAAAKAAEDQADAHPDDEDARAALAAAEAATVEADATLATAEAAEAAAGITAPTVAADAPATPKATRGTRTFNPAGVTEHQCEGECGEVKKLASFPTVAGGKRGVECRGCRDTRIKAAKAAK